MSRKLRRCRQLVEVESMEGRRLYAAHPAFDLLYPSAGPYAPGHVVHVNVSMGGFERGTRLPVSVSLSTDDVVGNGDDVPLGTATARNGYRPPPSGDPGLVETAIGDCDFDVTLPAGLAPGHYHLVASAPGVEPFVGEAIDVTTPTDAPDLSFAPYEFVNTRPQVAPGDEAYVMTHVSNTGTQPAGLVKANVYYSKDDVAGNGDDVLVGSGTVMVGAFSTNEVGMIWYTVPDLPAGEYHPVVVLDPDNRVAEADESNNVLVARAVTVGAAQTDLSVASLTTDLTSGTAGTAVTVNLGVKVAGAGVSSVRVAFMLAFDHDGTADGPMIEWAAHTYDVPLAADGTTQLPPVVLTLPDWVVPGTYHITAEVDEGNYLAETDEGNNWYTGPTVTVLPYGSPDDAPGEDPAGDAGNAPAAVLAPGGTGSTSLTLTNDAAEASRGTYDVSFYLSDDPTLSAGDRLFSRKAIRAKVAAHGAATVGLRYTLPRNAPVGTQYLIAVAAPRGSGAAAAAGRANRAAVKAAGGRVLAVSRITVAGPRLSASVVSVKPGAAAGTSRVTVRVANDGAAPFAAAATLELLTDSADPVSLLKVRKALALKAGRHVDLTFVVDRPSTTAIRAAVS